MRIVTAVLSVVALILALLAILNVVPSATALGLAVICVALAMAIPALEDFTGHQGVHASRTGMSETRGDHL